MDPFSQITRYHDYCSKVSSSISPTSKDDDLVMRLLLDKTNHFETICNLAFGELVVPDSGVQYDRDNYCWMDLANNYPDPINNPISKALLELLGPGGSLFRIMHQVSAPDTDFNAKLNGKWKGVDKSEQPSIPRDEPSIPRRDEPETIGYPWRTLFNIPLKSVCGSGDAALDLLSESGYTNLADLSRDSVPPFLLIPFWQPGLKTTVNQQGRGQVVVRCTMMSYFLIRMFGYVRYRSEVHSNEIVRVAKKGTFSWLATNVVSDAIYRQFMGEDGYKRPSTTFPFYEHLLFCYLEHFVANSSFQNFPLKKSSLHRGWTESEVYACLMVHGPSQIWLNASNKSIIECRRVSCHDPVIFATLCQSLWYLDGLFYTLQEGARKYPLITSADFGRLSCDDLMVPFRTCFRTCLVAIRQFCLSAKNFSSVQDIHFQHLVALWRSLVRQPDDITESAIKLHFIHHFEAYSSILIDIFDMVVVSTFCKNVSPRTVDVLRKGLEELAAPLLMELMYQSTSLVQGKGGSAGLDRIKQFFVLRWEDEYSLEPAVIAPQGTEVTVAAAKAAIAVYRSIEELDETNLASDTPSKEVETKKKAFMNLLDVMNVVYPQLRKTVEEKKMEGYIHKDFQDAGKTNRNNEYVGPHQHWLMSGPPSTMNREERDDFFAGIKPSRHPSNVKGLQFVSGSLSSQKYAVVKSSEIPLLLPLVSLIDGCIEYIQLCLFSREQPKCMNGHALHLVADERKFCSMRLNNQAVWECGICGSGYCSSCVGPPTVGGRKVRRISPSKWRDPLGSYCSRCMIVLDGPFTVAYNVDGALQCAGCTSRPPRVISCRFMASKCCYVLVLLLVLLYYCVVPILDNVLF